MEINAFPADWNLKKLSEIGESYAGLKSKSKSDFNEEGNMRFVTYRNINQNYFVDVNELGSVHVGMEENQNNVLKGDVLFTGSSETPTEVGFSSVMLNDENEVFLNSFCFGYRFINLDDFYPKFFGYYFRGHVFRKSVFPLAQGSTRYNLSRKELLNIEVPVPHIKEQKKIATILFSLDEAIEKTEAIIEQTEKVKKGLMQQLLTQGLGHTKFKKTAYGDIPEEWSVAKISNIGELKSGSTPNRKESAYFQNGTIPWVKTLDLTNNKVVKSQEKITDLALKETSCKILPKGTVLVAMYGGFNQIGRTGLLSIDAAINQAMTGIIPNQEVVLSEYLLYWLNYKVNKWKRFAASSRKDPNITKSDVKNFDVVLPTLEEQRNICEIISVVTQRVQNEKKKLMQLQILKKGLMQDLLTGKVRVKVDEEEVVSS